MKRRPVVDFRELHARLDEAEAALASADDQLAESRRARTQAVLERPVETTDGLGVLTFSVAGFRLGVPLIEIEHVLESSGLSALPGLPSHVLGALVSRGRVVPVLDLRALLDSLGGGTSDLGRVVVVNDGGDVFGLAVQDVDQPRTLRFDQFTAAPPGPFRGRCDDVLVLDITKLGSA